MARMPFSSTVALLALVTLSTGALAETEAVSSSVPTATSMLKLGLMLGVVIFMFVAFAWVMKRMSGLSPRGGEGMKVSGGVSLGQRERLVVVEVDQQRLLLGVTPHSINLIRELSPTQDFDSTLKEAMPESMK